MEGLKDGTIDVIATDHAPHSIVEKEQEFALAPPGMIGLETAFSLVMSELVDKGVLSLEQAVAKMTINPAKILRLEGGSLSEGADADITIVDPDKRYTVDAEHFASKSKNSPFIGREVRGVVETVIVAGQPVLENGKFVLEKSETENSEQ